ncbi:Uncharacterized N-acetyltransferase YjgM [Galdieria sulphuraria]|uniref:Putative acetyltransferase n=1 Tax=Galdieria sulphuraria TaxID=130081 RepID=M2WRL5_GALSU|nr:putative acetyltransferase [Galdieria sulphuraria]EME26455.1 putative acetyltransferase [Galdieria sulphuraria]GJD12306.1 Uncharacterized N-acetyltransferase YjgM [Galdieria sulphuraria]|eukprot:XP_005702975.1 putative acetyltransferase [Galdieria sulphuraria]
MITSDDVTNLDKVLFAKPSQRKAGADFCTFSGLLTIRSWKPKDRTATEELVKAALEEHGLEFDPFDTDVDLSHPEKYYYPSGGELWVLEKNDKIVGCAGFLPLSEASTVEFRKMYFSPSVRGQGYGKLILGALESRAFELGYRESRLETSHLLEAACKLYEKMGYVSYEQVHTPRCSRAYKKDLRQQYESVNNYTDNVYWLDTEGRLFSLVKKEVAIRHAVLCKMWKFGLHTNDSKLSLFPSQRKQKLYQSFLWSIGNEELRSWLMKLKDTCSDKLEVHLSKNQHIILPSTRQHVFVQVINCVVGSSSVLPLSILLELNDVESNQIDKDDLFIWKEQEQSISS